MTAAQLSTELLLGAGLLVTVSASVCATLVGTVLDRLHLLTVVTSFGAPLIGAALVIENGWGTATGQIVLIVVLLAATGPVLGSATGRLARRTEQPQDGDDGP